MGIVDEIVLQCRDGLGSNRWRRDSVCTIWHIPHVLAGITTLAVVVQYLDTCWSDGPSHSDAAAGHEGFEFYRNRGHRDVFSVEK